MNPYLEALIGIPTVMLTPFLILLVRKQFFEHQMQRTDLSKNQWKKYFRRCMWNYMGMQASNSLINNRWEEHKGKISPSQAVFNEFE